MIPKPPTLDTAPDDLAHAPEVPHHRFSVFYESGDYAYARGLEVNPTHLPIALDAMRKSGWRLVSIFGQTDSQHIGAIFRREPGPFKHADFISLHNENARLQARVDELLRANNALVEQRRTADRRVEEAFRAGCDAYDGKSHWASVDDLWRSFAG